MTTMTLSFPERDIKIKHNQQSKEFNLTVTENKKRKINFSKPISSTIEETLPKLFDNTSEEFQKLWHEAGGLITCTFSSLIKGVSKVAILKAAKAGKIRIYCYKERSLFSYSDVLAYTPVIEKKQKKIC